MWCPTNASQFPVVGYPLKLHGHPYAQLQAWITSASIFHFVGNRSLLSVEGQRHSAYNRILRLPRFALYMVRAIAASVDRRVGDCRRRFVDASILSEVTPGGRAPPIPGCFLRRDASAAEGCKEPQQDYHRRKINARHDRTAAQQGSKPKRAPPPSERPEGEQEIREICAHRREQHGGRENGRRDWIRQDE